MSTVACACNARMKKLETIQSRSSTGESWVPVKYPVSKNKVVNEWLLKNS